MSQALPQAQPQIRPTTMEFGTAWRALRKLLADPEATEEVFVIIRALTGKSLLRSYNRFSATPVGSQVLAERRELLPVLEDRVALAALPEGSLGRTYLAFVEQEQLTADGLVAASEVDSGGQQFASEGMDRYVRRLRDSHDLWHVLTGYGRDVLGETCLLGFTYAQGRNPGLGFIAVAGANRLSRSLGFSAWRALWCGYRDGRKAAWLHVADWEQLLSQPLESVRRQLQIAPPVLYQELRQAILQADPQAQPVPAAAPAPA